MPADLPSLYFGQTVEVTGFTNNSLSQFDGSAEPVVRELMQNSLDASRAAGRPAHVLFRIMEMPAKQMPGRYEYAEAFELACQERQRWHQGIPSHDEAMAISRIRAMLQRDSLPVLVCSDNGIGMDGRGMDALLTTGNTSKGADGVGSFGLGHFTAFSASDLRYLLYVSRHIPDGGKRSDIRTLMSGHAVLATHMDPAGKQRRGADGYWLQNTADSIPFDGSYSHYANSVPEDFSRCIDIPPDTGTAVCIPGFNDFRADPDDPAAIPSATAIARVAAANFAAAIHHRELTINIIDERSGDQQTIARPDLLGILQPISNRERADQQGQISGYRAYRAAQTLQTGAVLEIDEGTTVYWRHLEHGKTGKSQCHLNRGGMWIVSNLAGFMNKFTSARPFDAVVHIESGPGEKLVRDAEGPAHREIIRSRLTSAQRAELSDYLNRIAYKLLAEVGEVAADDYYVPTGFASVAGSQIAQAEPMTRLRPMGFGSSDATGPKGDSDGSGARTPKAGKRPPPGQAPSVGTMLKVALNNRRRVTALVGYKEKADRKMELGVRIRSSSGSDNTCESPLGAEWLKITSVKPLNGATYLPPNGDPSAYEISIPMSTGTEDHLVVMLEDKADDASLLEMDVVRRRTPEPNGDDTEEDDDQ